MKKTYLKPETQVSAFQYSHQLLDNSVNSVSSTGLDGGESLTRGSEQKNNWEDSW